MSVNRLNALATLDRTRMGFEGIRLCFIFFEMTSVACFAISRNFASASLCILPHQSMRLAEYCRKIKESQFLRAA